MASTHVHLTSFTCSDKERDSYVEQWDNNKEHKQKFMQRMKKCFAGHDDIAFIRKVSPNMEKVPKTPKFYGIASESIKDILSKKKTFPGLYPEIVPKLYEDSCEELEFKTFVDTNPFTLEWNANEYYYYLVPTEDTNQLEMINFDGDDTMFLPISHKHKFRINYGALYGVWVGCSTLVLIWIEDNTYV